MTDDGKRANNLCTYRGRRPSPAALDDFARLPFRAALVRSRTPFGHPAPRHGAGFSFPPRR